METAIEGPRLFTGRLELIAEAPAGFCGWEIVRVRPRARVGSVRVTAPVDGAVECSGAIASAHRRHGYGAEAFGAILDWAFSQAEVRCVFVIAPDEPAAVRVLENNGLARAGHGPTAGTLRYELRRP